MLPDMTSEPTMGPFEFDDDPRVSQCETFRNPRFSSVEEEELVARYHSLSTDSLENAIERGRIIKDLLYGQKWSWPQIEKRLKCKRSTGYKLIQLVDHPRMHRTDWEKPGRWSVCHILLTWRDRPFEEFRPYSNRYTTRTEVQLFLRAYHQRLRQQRANNDVVSEIMERNYSELSPLLNRVIDVDCMEGILRLPPNSVGTVITSPPYANQMEGFYDGIPPQDYPEWFRKWMDALWRVLVDDGNVIVVICPHIENGWLNQYVKRAVLEVCDKGWGECAELIWSKPDAPPLGSNERPRHATEQILWLSKSRNPYIDLLACGRPSKRKGLEGSDRFGSIHGFSSCIDGTANVTNVFTAYIAEIDRGVDHPAMFPPTLVRQLIRTFAKPGYIILDPFAGAGTTCLVAQAHDYDFIGFDNGVSKSTGERFADMANLRLRTEPKYFRGAAKLQDEQEQLHFLEMDIAAQRQQIEILRQAASLLAQGEANLAALYEKVRLVNERVKGLLVRKAGA